MIVWVTMDTPRPLDRIGGMVYGAHETICPVQLIETYSDRTRCNAQYRSWHRFWGAAGLAVPQKEGAIGRANLFGVLPVTVHRAASLRAMNGYTGFNYAHALTEPKCRSPLRLVLDRS